jgi:hypothetical protein
MRKYFSHPSFTYLLFSNPTHKPENGTANRWETTNSNPPGPIKQSGKSQHMLGFAVPFTGLSILCKNAGPKPCVAKPNWHLLTFVPPIFFCRATY